MNILEQLLELSETKKHPKDFFHALTKLSRIFAGQPQEYGFHHHHDKTKYHGTFCTRDTRGKVYKKDMPNNSAVYTCKFEKENLIDKHLRHEEILEAVKASSPQSWSFVNMSTFKKCKDPCYAVEHGKSKGDIDIHVRQDIHPAIK